jgi:murein L,D-transpeptidase YcbB/YkuD
MFRRLRRRWKRADLPRRALYVGMATLVVALCALAVSVFHILTTPANADFEEALSGTDAAYMQPAYAARDFKPVWLAGKTPDPAATQLIQDLENSGADGLSPAAYHPEILKEKIAHLPHSSAAERIKTELLLSDTYARYIKDLHTPAAGSDVVFTDDALQPAFRSPEAILDHLTKAPSAQVALRQSTEMNPLYAQLRAALNHPGIVPTAAPDGTLLRNLDRLRALPPHLGWRFVLVDAASSRLWLYENGKPVDSMRVVVGAKVHQTPQLAGVIRYAIFNPYWNVPPDLTRDVYAPRILANRSALASLHMDAWSDFAPNATVLDPQAVDWDAVVHGRTVAWLRQRPGPYNSMGRVKFMLPNTLGIYLHDTPNKDLFVNDQRDNSAGCVRVEDAKRLSHWLYGREVTVRGTAEQGVNLPSPTPVYILYLTIRPPNLGNTSYQDPYGRDQAPGSAPSAKQARGPAVTAGA